MDVNEFVDMVMPGVGERCPVDGCAEWQDHIRVDYLRIRGIRGDTPDASLAMTAPGDGCQPNEWSSSKVSAETTDTTEPATPMQNDPQIPRLVGMTEAAEILGVVRERVWQLLNEGKLQGRKVGNMIVMREQVVLEYKARMDRERSSQAADT